MIFQEWNNKIEPRRYLEKAWINVYGVPYEIRSYLSLWVVGTILGATLKVDMKYTRKMEVVRILVGVMDVNNIPDTTDIADGANLDDDDLLDNLGAADESANRDTDMMQNDAPTDDKDQDDTPPIEKKQDDTHPSEQNTQVEGDERIKRMVNEVIDKAAFDLINKITAEVAAKKDYSDGNSIVFL
ncbi:hypothetical protein PR202_ga08021 [Eleusine coracana subsp. coracana]|uniref:DUF4283 domain-containing protein n=1 Tax=Eleusine coracana subsp. coracana TaxID=191504 RepID=A0AAV5BZI6_ELECO|nr:hypothetical protein PR202_ga08021 [Eleusine coracana subsp. coracana]